MLSLADLAKTYHPYNYAPAFFKGIEDYWDGRANRVFPSQINQQAYDRGMECAMRFDQQDSLGLA